MMRRTWCRRTSLSLVAVASVLLAGCGDDTDGDPADEQESEASALPAVPMDTAPAAVVDGQLVLQDDCVLLRIAEEGDLLVIWPPGTELANVGGSQTVTMAGGEAAGAIGDDVSLAGGTAPSTGLDRDDLGSSEPCRTDPVVFTSGPA